MSTSNSTSRKVTSVTSLVMTAMCTAIIAALSQITFPLPTGVPVTLQTFAIALTGFILGWKSGVIATLVYIILGLLGAPVFSGFNGGAHVLFGKTGGFIIGFLFMVIFCGIGYETKQKFHHALLFTLPALGLIICHGIGILQFSLLTHMSFIISFTYVSLPFILKDILSIIAAYFVAITVRKTIGR